MLKYYIKRYCLENEIESLKRKIYKYDEEFFREIVDLKLRKKLSNKDLAIKFERSDI
ncbi:hypothetical protein [Pseudostreptobacillus hongkongensis]|uniref:hypothetical protein n=1 Tax=Pseudostreptobacillus hongkongensis TaxID=1162717 RepID=UPI0028D67341|nr:hypothetical protein [Pseudostreptobacillus hongkongensis]